jgi:hypothetical protein
VSNDFKILKGIYMIFLMMPSITRKEHLFKTMIVKYACCFEYVLTCCYEDRVGKNIVNLSIGRVNKVLICLEV